MTRCKVLEARLADGHRFFASFKVYPMAQERVVQGMFKPCPAAVRLLPAFLPPMPLLLSGRGFRQELERANVLALFCPLEGGAETRLLRRLRAAGYQAQITSARGLGDPEAFLMRLHGVRPPHLGHQSVGRGAAVGEVHQVMPQLGALLEGSAPIVLWLLEGQVLSAAELGALITLAQREPRLRIVVEMGGSRALRWQPLADLL
jgi:NAD(P)H-quinone oxidoreductase subunit N